MELFQKQTRRINAIKNTLSTAVPLSLLEDGRLKELASAYSGVYCLPTYSDYTQANWKKLKAAHGRLMCEVTQFKERDADHWDPENGIFENYNRHVYGRLGLKTFDQMVEDQRVKFQNVRYNGYLNSISDAA